MQGVVTLCQLKFEASPATKTFKFSQKFIYIWLLPFEIGSSTAWNALEVY